MSITNDTPYCYPNSVSDLVEQPLYLAVAFWGLRNNELLTVTTVSREFLISQKTASDVLYYIEHNGGRYIKFKRKMISGERDNKIRRRALKILEVLKPERECVFPKPSREKRRTMVYSGLKQENNTSSFHLLRKWIISRPLGSLVPSTLLQINN